MGHARLTQRIAAVGLLIGAVATAALSAWWACATYGAGQREIADKRAQWHALRDLADAREAFSRLLPKGKGQGLILPADADAATVLSAAIAHAADGQQVIVDGIEPLTTEPAQPAAAIHLRGTQVGLYAFLGAIEQQTPYMLVLRLELTPSRAADPEHGKPLVLAADLRVTMLVSPAMKGRTTAPPGDAKL